MMNSLQYAFQDYCENIRQKVSSLNDWQATVPLNGRRITLNLGKLLVVSGVIMTLVGGAAFFGAFTAIGAGSWTAKILILGGVSAVILGLFCLRMRKVPLDLDAAILKENVKTLEEWIKTKKLDLDAKSQCGLTYIELVVLYRSKEDFDALVPYSQKSKENRDLYIEFDKTCQNFQKTLNEYKEEIETLDKDDDDRKKELRQSILDVCPISYRKTLLVDPDLNLKEKLRAQPDENGRNYWHRLADPKLTKDHQKYLHCWLVPEAKAKLTEKDKDGLTPLDIACKENNVDFIKTLTDPTNGGVVDWNEPCFESLLNHLFQEKMNKMDTTLLDDGELEAFQEIVDLLALCHPSLVDQIKMNNTQKRTSGTTKVFNEEMVKISDKSNLIWQRKVEERMSSIALTFYQTNGKTLWDIVA